MDDEDQKRDVSKIISNFNKAVEKKAKKKENAFMTFAIKAIARNQEQNFQIYKLRRDLCKSEEALQFLKMENEVKEEELQTLKNVKEKELQILRNIKEKELQTLKNVKEKELQTLKNENERLQTLLQQMQECKQKQEESINVVDEDEKPYKIYNYNNNEVISTFSNIIASPSKLNVVSTSDPVVSTSNTNTVMDNSAKPSNSKKRSSKKGQKESNFPNFIYNLRKKNK